MAPQVAGAEVYHGSESCGKKTNGPILPDTKIKAIGKLGDTKISGYAEQHKLEEVSGVKSEEQNEESAIAGTNEKSVMRGMKKSSALQIEKSGIAGMKENEQSAIAGMKENEQSAIARTNKKSVLRGMKNSSAPQIEKSGIAGMEKNEESAMGKMKKSSAGARE